MGVVGFRRNSLTNLEPCACWSYSRNYSCKFQVAVAVLFGSPVEPLFCWPGQGRCQQDVSIAPRCSEGPKSWIVWVSVFLQGFHSVSHGIELWLTSLGSLIETGKRRGLRGRRSLEEKLPLVTFACRCSSISRLLTVRPWSQSPALTIVASSVSDWDDCSY